MTNKTTREVEVEQLVEKWTIAVANLWRQVIDRAKDGTVSCPMYQEKFGGVAVIMSARGVEVVIGSQGTSFTALVNTANFNVSEFTKVRKFVSDSIRKGMADVLKAIEDREESMKTAFSDLQKDIAEWNLVCDKGKEIK